MSENSDRAMGSSFVPELVTVCGLAPLLSSEPEPEVISTSAAITTRGRRAAAAQRIRVADMSGIIGRRRRQAEAP
jgi:hypothetical protein